MQVCLLAHCDDPGLSCWRSPLLTTHGGGTLHTFTVGIAAIVRVSGPSVTTWRLKPCATPSHDNNVIA